MKKILYLGLELPHQHLEGQVVHCPIIQITPRPITDQKVSQALKDIPHYSHLIFTSKSSVRIFIDYALRSYDLTLLQAKTSIVIGHATAHALHKQGVIPKYVARQETAEGVIKVLERLSLENAYVFLPQSTLSRPTIPQYLAQRDILHRCCILYETSPRIPDPLPHVEDYDEIVFTSPSTVDAFLIVFGQIPWHKTLIPIGPITAVKLSQKPSLEKK